jgi:hypothetical protein
MDVRLGWRALRRVESRRVLLLNGFLIWLAVGVAVLAAGRCGLLQEVWRADRTGVALGVTLVFVGSALQGSWHVVRLSRALRHLCEVEQYVARHGSFAFRRGVELPGPHSNFPEGYVTEHIRHLERRAEFSDGGRLDQTLLLEAFEADLRGGLELGGFVAHLLLSLGLLGTVIGLLLMLGRVGGLGGIDVSAPAMMSGGVAVALYATLACLVGGMLLRLQGVLLEGAVKEMVGRTIRLTETFVLPALERHSIRSRSNELSPMRRGGVAGGSALKAHLGCDLDPPPVRPILPPATG